MTLFSPAYLVFVAVALAGFHLVPRDRRVVWLLLCSYAFYGLYALRFLPVLLGVTLVTYLVGRRLGGARGTDRALLAAGIAVNLSALALLRWAFRGAPFEAPFVVLGASFYVLQAISFLVESARGRMGDRVTLGELALYLAYFPKIPAGPIERPARLIARLREPAVVDDAAVGRAACLILVGLVRKLVLAEPLRAALPDQAFSEPASFGALGLLVCLLGFALMLYNDFAGYTSIARGTSLLFGIELSPNFRQPMFSSRFHEFWSRWHMSFTAWLRDYVFLPVASALRRRGRRDPIAIALPRLAAMAASGLWHGDGLHMLVWGGLHGIYLTVERLGQLARIGRARGGPATHAVAIAFVFGLSILTFAFFRMESAPALSLLGRLATGASGAGVSPLLVLPTMFTVALDAVEARWGELAFLKVSSRAGRAVLAVAAILACLVAANAVTPAPFVYQGF